MKNKDGIEKIKKHNKGLIAEFKAFISRGNVVDMATGVIVASAFTKIVTALTNSIIMPFVNWLVSLVTGGEKVLLATVLNGESLYVEVDGVQTINEKAVYLNWSDFIEAIFNFLLIAIIIFLILKVINTIHKKLEQGTAFLHRKERKAAEAAAEQAKKEAEEKAKAEAELKAKLDKEKAENTSTNELLVEVINLLKK